MMQFKLFIGIAGRADKSAVIRINLTKKHIDIRRGEGEEGWMGGPLWSPGVVGKLAVHRQAEVFRRPTAGDHKGPHHIHTTALAPTESWGGA